MVDRTGEKLVFVYGSLLRGEAHHDLLTHARFVGEGHTPPDYRLVDMGDFPALVYPGDTSVVGEVYAVDAHTLELLDELEDHPSYYRRTTIELADGTDVWAYLLPPMHASGHPTVTSGDWRERVQTRIA